MADDKKTTVAEKAKTPAKTRSYTFTKLGLVIQATSYHEAQKLAQETEQFKAYIEGKEK